MRVPPSKQKCTESARGFEREKMIRPVIAGARPGCLLRRRVRVYGVVRYKTHVNMFTDRCMYMLPRTAECIRGAQWYRHSVQIQG